MLNSHAHETNPDTPPPLHSRTADLQSGLAGNNNNPSPPPWAESDPRWMLRPEADYLNALCKKRLIFPETDNPFEESARTQVANAFNEGFKAVRSLSYQRALSSDANGTEMRLWMAISHKTFGFGKFLEKIPHRLFVRGQGSENDGLNLEPGTAIIPAIVSHKSKMSKPLKALVRSGLISRIASDPHPLYGASSIYCAMEITASRDALIRNASSHLRERGRNGLEQSIFEQIEAHIRGFDQFYRDAADYYETACVTLNAQDATD